MVALAQTEMVEEWWSENLYCHLYFPQNHNQFLYKNIILHGVFSISFTGSRFNEI